MLIVKTIVEESKLHGKGLFADENIKRGRIVWKYNHLIDRKISQKKLLHLPAIVQRFIKYYSYVNNKNEFVLCGDDARYINNSDNPNTQDKVSFSDKLFGREGICTALRNIKKGEEI